jgi:hypothetical protein
MLNKLYSKIKSNDYKYFIYKSLILFIALFTIDFTIGNTLQYFYFQQTSGEQYRTTHAIEHTTADVIVFGSSRATNHYHPEVFENKLSPSCYNAGRGGNFLFYHYAVLQGVLARHKPKLVILDLVAQEFTIDQANYDRISSLLPYYRKHPEMRDIIALKSGNERIKLLSSIYPFNSSIFTIAIGNTEFNKKRKPDNRGYVPFNKKISGPMEESVLPLTHEIDSTKLKVYASFIKDCQKAGVTLIVVCSPYYINFRQPIYSIKLAKEIADRNNILFLDYSSHQLFVNKPEYFADYSHLNDDGARIFSDLVVKDIQAKIPD